MKTTHRAGLSLVRAFVSVFRLPKQPTLTVATLTCRNDRGVHEYSVNRGWLHGSAACRTFVIGAACLGILVGDTQAAITFSNPVRSVSASNNKGSSQAIETHAYGSFNESARVDWEEYWSYPNSYLGQYPNTTGQYFSTATQESTIGLTGVAARGSVTGTGTFFFYGENPLFQASRSYFKINILLDAPGNIHLNGLIKSDYDPWGGNNDFPEILVTLAGENGEYYSKKISAGYEYENKINESFISLPSGQYEFVVSVKTVGGYRANQISYDETGVWIDPGAGGYGSATYDITLVPEPSTMVVEFLGCLLFVLKRNRTA